MVEEKSKLIERILSIELNMFQRVPTLSPTSCQQSPGGFKLVRGSVFESWPEETLESYLEDLHQALQENRNLMTEKYARMDNLIPCLNRNPIIDDIVSIEKEWQAEVGRKYPHILSQSQPEYCGDPAASLSFQVYLRSELETYSNRTLNFYFWHISKALDEGRNLIEERYARMFQRLGYDSLDQAEQDLKGKMTQG
jgi:hypothetical protein